MSMLKALNSCLLVRAVVIASSKLVTAMIMQC